MTAAETVTNLATAIETPPMAVPVMAQVDPLIPHTDAKETTRPSTARTAEETTILDEGEDADAVEAAGHEVVVRATITPCDATDAEKQATLKRTARTHRRHYH